MGAFPALVAIALRFTIPETPRYLIDVREDLDGAAQATYRVYPEEKNTPTRQSSERSQATESQPRQVLDDKEIGVLHNSSAAVVNDEHAQANAGSTPRARTGALTNGSQTSRQNAQQQNIGNASSNRAESEISEVPRAQNAVGGNHGLKVDEPEVDQRSIRSGRPKVEEVKIEDTAFWHEWTYTYGKGKGFRRMLAAISICWFILDVCFYGLGLDTPRTLAKIFGASPSDSTPHPFDWNSGFGSQDQNIYDALLGDAKRALYTIPISGITGSVVFICLVNYIPRVIVLRWTFVALAIVFALAGSTLTNVYETNNHSLTVVFYAFALCILNFGPNTILFMLPAELFPTR